MYLYVLFGWLLTVCNTYSFLWKKTRQKKWFFALVIGAYWCLWWLHLHIWWNVPRAYNNAQKYTQPLAVFSKLAKCFLNTFIKDHPWLSASAECTSQNCSDSPIILCLWCFVLWKELWSANKLRKIEWSPQEDISSKKFTSQPKAHTLRRERDY